MRPSREVESLQGFYRERPLRRRTHHKEHSDMRVLQEAIDKRLTACCALPLLTAIVK